MSGCPKQTLHLSPIDVDGDNIRCRFSDENEAQVFSLRLDFNFLVLLIQVDIIKYILFFYQGAFRGDNYNSITIDEENCILIYDGTKDLTKSGVKPIAVQEKIEIFS